MAAPDAEMFRLLIASVQDYAIFLLDPQGRVQTWNPGAQQIKGYQPEEIIGQHIARFYTADDVAAGKPQHLLAAATAEGRVEDEGWRVRKDGSRFWADVVITALRDPQGTLVGFGKVTRDLSQRRKHEQALRQSEERMRLMIASVQDYAFYMLDPSGRVTSWNPGAERIKGYRAAEIVGQHFSKFFPAEDTAAGKPAMELELAEAKGTFEAESWRIRKDGSRFWCNIIISAVRDDAGTLLGFTKITRDLTDRRRTEEERVRLAQAQESVRLRDEFLSIASHELRTPLTALQLQLHMLGERASNPDLKQRVGRAKRSGERLADLVEALLSVSRIATGRIDLTRERFALADVAADVIERVREGGAQVGSEVTLVVKDRAEGTWDRLRIEQVVMNLLSNAFRYAPGTPVTVEISCEGKDAMVEVHDRGPGIAAGQLDRIFERFERAGSASAGGLGLGLYIVRQLVEAHGGRIRARNAASGGAVFTVRLPTG